MSKSKIYLDTSVISAYFDLRKPVRRTMTQKWFQHELKNLSPYAPTLVIEEIGAHPDESTRKSMLDLWEVTSMGIYKNDYSKNGDSVLWNLHEIRNRMARKGLRREDLNHSARALIRKYQLSRLKLVKTA